jgi:mono/diheme cytochrome c family protein
MKTTLKIFLASITFAVIFIFLFNTAAHAQAKKPWVIPDKYKAMKNPTKAGDAAAVANGKELWAKHCKSCHGSKGLGDGPKAASLKTPAGDFSTAAFQGQSDGALYYETAVGRDEMPGFEKKIPNQKDIWDLVTYMRTLKK